MGELSQNLLKLTEFPFSYSLIGLLALIFGQGSGFEQLDFAKTGPLLILMGFLATVLSICDPVGALQRLKIKEGRLVSYWESFEKDTDGTTSNAVRTHDLDQDIFGLSIFRGYFDTSVLYMLSMLYSPADIRKRYSDLKPYLIHWVARNGNLEEKSIASYIERYRLNDVDPGELAKDMRSIDNVRAKKIVQNVYDDFTNIINGIGDLKENTVRTKWITAEIDRITALVYFMIIISLFIIAALVSLVYPAFFQHFTKNFPDIVTRIVILILSSMALGGVIYMFKLRIEGLRKKATTVLRYLIALQTIKSIEEKFKVALRDIERYLNDDEWALAGYWVHRIRLEYHELLEAEANKPIASPVDPLEDKYKLVNEYD